jgi:hypothetical protein
MFAKPSVVFSLTIRVAGCLFAVLAATLAAGQSPAPQEAAKEAPQEASREAADAPAPMSDVAAMGFLGQYCLVCHSGDEPEAELDLSRFDSPEKIVTDADVWNKIVTRVGASEMPPEEGELPSVSDRKAFLAWIGHTMRQVSCGDGIAPGAARLRRMNSSEYAATIRDLLGIQIDAAEGLPSDGAGGEGFDNASETLFISPIHAEKYLEAARNAVGYAFSDTRSQRVFLTAEPSDEVTPSQAARQVLGDFLKRAFRRPVGDEELTEYMELFELAYARDPAYFEALRFAMEAVLVSPKFLFLMEEPNLEPTPVPITQHELASRLSYFLWGSMPDQQLMSLADEGKLFDEEVLKGEIIRMLGGGVAPESDIRERRRQRRDDRVRYFAQSFIEQWLGTRALGREFRPDPSVGPYDSELEGGMKYEPVFFFDYILSQNRSILEFLDADYTFVHRRLARHYGIDGDFREQPRLTQLPEGSHRGGLLGMSAILAVSSRPHRTSPVLRGKWILETLLGTPPPPPPPNVPPLDEKQVGQAPQTLRARLELHRQNPTCASCHDRIDPVGFALENYDVLGQWRSEDAGQPIDARGELPDGTVFEGPQQLKQVLLARKDDFARHLTKKLLGYALSRTLTNEDYCVVEEIVDQLKENGYTSHTLILGIVRSVPFRYKAGTDPTAPVTLTTTSESSSCLPGEKE